MPTRSRYRRALLFMGIVACAALLGEAQRVLFYATVGAQETYSVAITNPTKVSQLDLGRAQHNRSRCLLNSLPEGCTQAEVCVAAGVEGGASCTVVDAVAAGQRIYPNSISGREAFIANELVRNKLPEYVKYQATLALGAMQAFCAVATPAQENALCAATGQSASCGICDNFK